MGNTELARIAQAMVAPGRGILAADESSNTIKRRFDAIGVESTAETRRDYRQLLFQTSDAMSKYVSGVILYDETIRQQARDGTSLVAVIEAAGALPGIKVDTGTVPLPFHAGEVVTEGLDGLRGRLNEYRKLGARFAKWRAVIAIGERIPTTACVSANAQALARYAALCQEADIVPIVEPEVLMDGGHDIEQCAATTKQVLMTVFAQLREAGVDLAGIVLKPNMVIPGQQSASLAEPGEIAERTVEVLKACVPSTVPGIAFLSGGQGDEEATANLNAINRVGGAPWPLTFSYGRALQAAPQRVWSGKTDNVAAAQLAFLHRAEMNSLASLGKWTPELEQKGRATAAA